MNTRSNAITVNDFPMLEKVKKTWGIYAVSILLKRLLFEYEHNYIPNEDVAHWLKKNALELQALEFETYLDSVIEIFYIKNAPSSPKSAKKSGRKNAE